MSRIMLGGFAAALLMLVPATAQGDSFGVHVRGTVGAKSGARHRVAVRSTRSLFALRVPGSLAAIRVGQRVELRGSTLRGSGKTNGVLANNVTIVASTPLAHAPAATTEDDPADDETEIDDDDQNTGPGSVDDDDDDESGVADDDADDDDDD